METDLFERLILIFKKLQKRINNNTLLFSTEMDNSKHDFKALLSIYSEKRMKTINFGYFFFSKLDEDEETLDRFKTYVNQFENFISKY